MSAKTDEETTETQNISGVTPEALEEKLKTEFEATHVEIQDISGMLYYRKSFEVISSLIIFVLQEDVVKCLKRLLCLPSSRRR